MLAAPLMSSLALLWIAIEVTTIISALLVAIEDTDGAAEAAWKYVLIASAGLGLALLATIFAYYAGCAGARRALRPGHPAADPAAARLPQTPVRLAFLLALLGYGTKVGLVPVHTWLPDAHSEAPTPVSALLSGALLATSFYAILRFYQVAAAALGSGFPRDALLAFGIASLLLAALYVFGQRDIKRLLAYSSVEHMGILAIGVSFGAPVALAGVLLHVLAHAAAKGNAFMGAGVFTVKYGTKQMSAMRGGLDCCRGAGRCSCSRSSRCPRCRRRASSAASSRSSTAAWAVATTPPRRCWWSWSRWRSSGWPRRPPRMLLPRPRGASAAGPATAASPAPGWWSRCWPGSRSCSCSACIRRASSPA